MICFTICSGQVFFLLSLTMKFHHQLRILCSFRFCLIFTKHGVKRVLGSQTYAIPMEYTSSPSHNICRHSIRKLPQPIVHLLRDTPPFEFQQKAEEIRQRKKTTKHEMFPRCLHIKKDFNFRNFFFTLSPAQFLRVWMKVNDFLQTVASKIFCLDINNYVFAVTEYILKLESMKHWTCKTFGWSIVWRIFKSSINRETSEINKG